MHSAEVGEAFDGWQLKMLRRPEASSSKTGSEHWNAVGVVMSVEDMIVNLDVVSHEAEPCGEMSVLGILDGLSGRNIWS